MSLREGDKKSTKKCHILFEWPPTKVSFSRMLHCLENACVNEELIAFFNPREKCFPTFLDSQTKNDRKISRRH